MKVIILTIALILSLTVNIFLAVRVNNKVQNGSNVVQPTKEVGNKNSTVSGEYSITPNIPVKKDDGFILSAVVINNISVKPFITKLAFRNCVVSDDGGVTYEIGVGDEKSFIKAILPGETNTVELGHIGEMWHECHYDNSGSQVCRKATDFNLKSCIAYISTSGDERVIGLPLKVDFSK